MNSFFVYIMTNRSRTLYIGVTSNLVKRVHEHKSKLVPGFTKSYNMTRLVHYEETRDAMVAIRREKQLKGWLRRKKIALIESANPAWQDLSAGWFDDSDSSVVPPAALRMTDYGVIMSHNQRRDGESRLHGGEQWVGN